LRYEVPPGVQGLRLSKFLYDRLKLSRTLVRRAKGQQSIRVNGVPVTVAHLLQAGDVVELHVDTESRVAAEPMALAVVYEDADLLVVNKPPGMVVHPVKDYTAGTLANGVAYHLQQRGEAPVARPVQRIDRDTSGLVLFAKNPAAAGRMAAELEKHKLDRRYIAFVHGRVEQASGTVAVPIRRVWGHSVAREAAVGLRTPEQEALLAEAAARGEVLREEWTAAGQRAVTHWAVLRRWETVTMLALQLETGRTHQIRVHMAHLGHSLLGDWLYSRRGAPGRQALHAATLVFAQPFTGAEVRLEAPLPADLQELIAMLDAGNLIE
jgi:23S rRNA pseudouridine1911/1915/1917 synthase